MADGVVKKLLVQFDADSSKGVSALKGINDATDKTGGFLNTALASLTGFVGGSAIIGVVSGAFSFLKDQVSDFVQEGESANQVIAQTAAGLKSTNDVSGMTAKSIGDLATHIMSLSGIDDDAVQTGENMLLTFTNIGKNVFPQATQAVADMATKMNGGAIPSSQGMQQAALQLGKALNDPITGISALARVGVTFSDQQKEQIKQFMKAGDVAGAQGVILKELNKEFGGSAAAAGQANGGIAILNAEFDNMKETIGQAVIPMLDDLMGAVSPLVTQFADDLPGAIDAVKPFLEDLATDGDNLAQGVGSLVSGFMSGLEPALLAIGQEIGPIAPSAKDVAGALKAFGDQAAGLKNMTPVAKELGKTVGKDLVKSFDELRDIWKAVSPFVISLTDGIGKGLVGAAKAVTPDIKDAWKATQQFGQEIEERAGPAIKNIQGFIQAAMPIIKAIWNDVWPGLAETFNGVWNVIKGIVQVAWSIVSGIIKVGLDILGGNWKQAWKDIQDTFSGVATGIESIGKGIMQIVQGDLKSGWDLVKGLFTGFETDAEDLGKNIVKGIGNGFGAKAGWLKQEAGNLAMDALNAMKNKLGIHSPSTVFAEVGKNTSLGFVQGMQGMDVAGAAADHFGKAPTAAVNALGGSNGASSAGSAFAAHTSGAGNGGGRQQNITLELDGMQLWRGMAPHAVDDIRLKTGANA